MSHDSGRDRRGGGQRENIEIALLKLEVERLRSLVPTHRKRPKLLILDLNGLLVHRVFVGEGPRADAEGALPRVTTTWCLNSCLVYKRPYVEDFLRFCLDNFFVGVWTTASAINATPLLKGLLPEEDVARLAFIWDGKRCTYNGETDPVKPGKPIAFKELRRLWESKDVAGLFGPSNTLMIDDSRYKASLNPPHTAIHPPAWDDPDAHASDDALGPSGNVRLYLQALLNSEVSVPDFVSATPFEAFQGARAATRLVSDASAMLDEGNSVRESESCAPLNEEDEDGEDEIVLAPGVSR